MFQIIDFFSIIFLTNLSIIEKSKKITPVDITPQRMYAYLKSLVSLNPSVVNHITHTRPTYYALTDAGFEIWTRFSQIRMNKDFSIFASYFMGLRTGLRAKLYTMLSELEQHTLYRSSLSNIKSLPIEEIRLLFQKYHITISHHDWIAEMVKKQFFQKINDHYVIESNILYFIGEIKEVDRVIYSRFEKHMSTSLEDSMIKNELHLIMNSLSKWNCTDIAVFSREGLPISEILKEDRVSPMHLAALSAMLVSTNTRQSEINHHSVIMDNYIVGYRRFAFFRILDDDRGLALIFDDPKVTDILRFGFSNHHLNIARSIENDNEQFVDEVWEIMNIDSELNTPAALFADFGIRIMSELHDQWHFSVMYAKNDGIGCTQREHFLHDKDEYIGLKFNEMIWTSEFIPPDQLQPNLKHMTYRSGERAGETIHYNAYDDLNQKIVAKKEIFLPFNDVLQQNIQHLQNFFTRL